MQPSLALNQLIGQANKSEPKSEPLSKLTVAPTKERKIMNEKKRDKKSIVTTLSIALAMATINAGSAMAQQVYPQRGQSPQQQQRDENECSNWATQQTGHRPSGSSSSDGGIISDRALRGAARGAGIGAIGGLIGGDAGTGAAVGAAVGGITGGIRNHDEKAQRQEFDRAFAACMEGRGYSVR